MIAVERDHRRGHAGMFRSVAVRFVGVSIDNIRPWVRSWLAKFETAKVGDGLISFTRFGKALNTA